MTLGEAMLKLGFNTDQNSVKEVENQMQKLKSTATKILGVIGISFSFSAMNTLAETYSDINQQIKSATDGLGDQEEIQQQILDAANESRLTYEAMADTVTDLINSDEELFDSLEDATEFATLTAKALQVAGESDSAIASAQSTLNDLIADGAMEATDFSSILSSYPELIDRMCDGLEVTQDELYDMCDAGEVTAETLVTAFSNAADDIESDFEELDYSISDAMTNISNQWGLFVEDLWEGSGLSNEIGTLLVEAFERLMTLLKRLQPLIERVIRALVDWLERALNVLDNVIEFCSNVANKLGGVENAAKLLMVVLGSIYAVMNASKILDFVTKLKEGISKISLKTIAIVAVIVAIALIVEDFINFLQGNDSVFGEILDSLGIDSEGVRDTILGVFNSVVEFFEENLPAIQAMFESVWGAIQSVVSAVMNAIWSIIQAVVNLIITIWDNWGTQITAIVQNAISIIGSIFSGLVTIITEIANLISAIFSGDFSAAFDALVNIVDAAWNMITSILEAGWEIIQNLFEIGAEVLGGIFEAIWDTLSSIANDIWTTLTTTFTNIWTSITGTVSDIADAIEDGFQDAIDFITGLPDKAIQWGKDIIQGIADGITGAISVVTDAVSSVGSAITDFLGFSVPDKGPLSDFESWMPDFMEGLAVGIDSNEDVVLDAVKDLASGVSTLAQGAVSSVGTAVSSAVSNVSNTDNSVTQNVNISNSYTGSADTAAANVRSSMKKSAEDTTTYLARALAYGAG